VNRIYLVGASSNLRIFTTSFFKEYINAEYELDAKCLACTIVSPSSSDACLRSIPPSLPAMKDSKYIPSYSCNNARAKSSKSAGDSALKSYDGMWTGSYLAAT
jgi:hypothetical protein